MAATRIEEFQQAFRNLQLQPLVTPEEIANFRVEYGDEWLDDLDDLIPEDIVIEIAKFSGGVVRELIRITQECCRLMLVQLRKKVRKQEPIDGLRINQDILTQALDILRNDMMITLSKSDREILKQTYDNYRPDDPKHQDFLDLLHNICVIEYRNAESWYDLHPLAIRQLKQEQII